MAADPVSEVLFTREQIAVRVAELGRQISTDYAEQDLVVVGILKGAFVFMADLLRAVGIPLSVDFVAISSYGPSTQSSGAVRIIKDLEESVEGRHVLLVEDIIDTGLTLKLSYIVENLKARKAASVRICTLLDKPSRREADVDAEYVGFVVPDKFVIGYGLDYDGLYRNLPYLGVLREDIVRAM